MKPYYESGGITIYWGDCREVLPTLGRFELLLTDVPYNLSQQSAGLRKLEYGSWDREFDVVAFLRVALPLVLRSAYVWCHETQLSPAINELQQQGFLDRALAWVKKNPTVINGDKLWLPGFESCAFGKRRGELFNAHCRPGVWWDSPDTDRTHPNQKPLDIFRAQIAASSTTGDTVVDPFMGSGTALRAAKDLGRRAAGIEIQEKYCEIAARRLDQEVLDLSGALPQPGEAADFPQPEKGKR